MTVIEKVACNESAYRRRLLPFGSAREAMRAYLASLRLRPGQRVALPAYVGWSAREGSGVFDPIRELGLDAAFYRVDRRLHLDVDDLRRVLADGTVGCVVLIHFFGYVDPAYREAAALARSAGAAILEDEAHAMLTDLVGGESGRLGDACIYSLHKLLPLAAGGSLVLNGDDRSAMTVGVDGVASDQRPFKFDLAGLGRRRRTNAEVLDRLIADAIPEIEPLWGPPRPFEVPQTYPVLVHGVSRDTLYATMNEAGFGVVSLYHTMIGEISAERFPDSHALARTVMNLPVHQDASHADLERMVEHLLAAVLAMPRIDDAA